MAKKAFTEGKGWAIVDGYGYLLEVLGPDVKKKEIYVGGGEKLVRVFITVIKK